MSSGAEARDTTNNDVQKRPLWHGRLIGNWFGIATGYQLLAHNSTAFSLLVIYLRSVVNRGAIARICRPPT